MKAPVRPKRRVPAQTNKKKIQAHSSSIYRACKQVHPAVMTSAGDFLTWKPGFPRPVLLRLVSAEASRLSRSNRMRVITVQELDAAVALVRRRIGTRVAA